LIGMVGQPLPAGALMAQPLRMIRGLALGALLALATSAALAADISKADQQFADEAARAGIAEVALAKLALEKTTNDHLRNFGERMVLDHGEANEALKDVSRRLVLTLPSSLDASQLQSLAELRKLSGAAFDRQYMHDVVAQHKKAVVLYDRQATAGDNAELRAFAAKTLPLLQRHLLLAEATQKAVVVQTKVAASDFGLASPCLAGASGESS
jgi:putative membrane protein